MDSFRLSGAFNQISGEGITGWEFWSADQDTILDCSMEMDKGLGAELTIV